MAFCGRVFATLKQAIQGERVRSLLTAARPIVADLGGTLAFYLIYLATGSPRLGATIGLALSVAQLVLLKLQRRQPPALLLMGVGLTLVLGGLTFFTQDARFLLIKPSLIYVCVGLAMLARGWLRRYFPQIVTETLPPEAINRAGWLWAGLMFGTALLNLALVAALPPRSAAAVLTMWASASKVALFLTQYLAIRRRLRRIRRAQSAAGAVSRV
jgi:intracellular septation protein A